MFQKREKIFNLTTEKKLRELYRAVFSSVQGRKVLTDMLIDLCVFDEIEREKNISFEEKAFLRNYGNKLLRKLGIMRSANVELIVEALMKMPIKV